MQNSEANRMNMYITSFFKNCSAFSWASSVTLSCLSTNFPATSMPFSITASCTFGFFRSVKAAAGNVRLSTSSSVSFSSPCCPVVSISVQTVSGCHLTWIIWHVKKQFDGSMKTVKRNYCIVVGNQTERFAEKGNCQLVWGRFACHRVAVARQNI